MIQKHSISILTSLCLAAVAAAQGEQTLRVTAKKGASVWLTQEQKQEQNIDQGGNQMEMTNTIVHTLHVTVLDVDDKGMLAVETEVVRIHGSMDMGPMGGETEFDSAAPAKSDDDDDSGMGMSAGAMTKQITKLAGKKFVAKVDTQGKVASLEGVAELLKGGRGMMGGPGQVTEGSLKQLVESAFGMLPEKPVAVGATWEHVQKEPGRVSSNHKVKLTLAKMDDAAFEITAVGTVEKPEVKNDGDDDKNPMAAMMKNMTISNGKITGTQKVSRQDGFLVEGSQSLSMDIEMETPMGSATVGVKQTTTTKRTTAEAAMPKKAEKTEPPKETPKSGDK